MSRPQTRLHGLQYIGNGVHLSARERKAETMPLHSHDYFELEILLAGQGRMELNSRQYGLAPGSVYFLTPADFHGVNLSEENRLWNISFDGSVLEPAQLEHLFSGNGSFRQTDGTVLGKLDVAARLLSEEADPDRQKLLVEYLLRTAGLWNEGEEPLTPIRRAVLYTETFFRDDPSLAEVAAHAGLSPSYFGNRFREETGETYVGYLNRCKVNCAAMLLKGGKSVTEACFESGFGSLTGFRYVFRQKTGMTPKEYSETYGKGRKFL